MQLPEVPPLPLAPLWDRVLRARTLPPDLDVELLYNAIRDRLTHPEWEVRLNALRVLADLLPLSGNALAFPFDEVVDNLGHNSPNVRKGALDALKVFCVHCEDPECAASAVIDKTSYSNIRPHSANIETKINVITGLVLSLPSVMGILKRRDPGLNLLPTFQILGDKLLDHVHRDVAQRSLFKMRKVCGPREYMTTLAQLDRVVQDKFRLLCDIYDEDSLDVYYAPRRSYSEHNAVSHHRICNSLNMPVRLSSESSSESSIGYPPYSNNNNLGKVIVETELQFDQNTAITMTVLEENETESEKHGACEDDYDSSDRNMLKYSEGDSEDPDLVVKKVRFGGESIKIRTPDSDSVHTSEDENKQKADSPENNFKDNIKEAVKPPSPVIVVKMNEIKREAIERESHVKHSKRSGIPLPIINHAKNSQLNYSTKANIKTKSKSLSELHEYFKSKNNFDSNFNNTKQNGLSLAWTLADVRASDPIPSPVEQHREIEVLHNLQKSPVLSPRKQRKHVHFEPDTFVLNIISSSSALDMDLLSPRQPTPLRERYEWEDSHLVPRHIIEQLHNTENWISAVKAADQLHSALLDEANVRKVEDSAVSLVQHMWALSDAVTAARAPAEGAVCALFRGARSDCARLMLKPMVARMARSPPLAAVPQALLQRLALHSLVDAIFDPEYIGIFGDSERMESAQLRAALCLARAAGPAAVLAAVRRRLAGTARADAFCYKLRDRLNRPVENTKQIHVSRSSQLPVPVRRRARSTPTPAPPAPPRRLRPLPDSAPLPGVTTNSSGKEIILKPLSPIMFNDRTRSVAGMGRRCGRRQSLSCRGGGMLCCCRSGVAPAPPAPLAPPLAPDLVADLPSHTRDSSSSSVPSQKCSTKDDDVKVSERIKTCDATKIGDIDQVDQALSRPRSPSIQVEEYSEKSNESPKSISQQSIETGSFKSGKGSEDRPHSPKSILRSASPSLYSFEKTKCPSEPVSRAASPKSFGSRRRTPEAISRAASPESERASSAEPGSAGERARAERDVRAALAECTLPPRHEDWQRIVSGLQETARLASERGARAPAAAWRAATRAAASHVRSLRSRVAREACATVGALFAARGRQLDAELEEAAAALLERCADANRFLRADAAEALARVACGGEGARAAAALTRRGAAHRAGPVRAAAAAALARLAARRPLLDLPPEPRVLLLRAAGDLLADAHPDTRLHARQLCLALADDERFKQLLKDAMLPSRYRAIEKIVQKLRTR